MKHFNIKPWFEHLKTLNLSYKRTRGVLYVVTIYSDYWGIFQFVFLSESFEEKQYKTRIWAKSSVMAALPNIGRALYSMLQSLANAHY